MLAIGTFFPNAEFTWPKPVRVKRMAPELSPDSGDNAMVIVLSVLLAPLKSMLTRGNCGPKVPATVNEDDWDDAIETLNPAIRTVLLNLPNTALVGTVKDAEEFDSMLQLISIPLLVPNKMKQEALEIKFTPVKATISPR